MKNYNSSSDRETRKILLVGDISKAFLDSGSITKKHYEVYANMLDAIDAAAKNNFAAIAVVMFGTSAKLSSALKTLRKVNSQAKIILLAQMYEEPIAVRLVGSAYNGTSPPSVWRASVADDYLICPIQPDMFYESIMTPQGRTAATAVDATVEMKIKQLERLATEDDLTGLKNRRYIWEFSRQIIEYAGKESGRVTLLVFDIDNFKHYNDVYGHCAGDEVLKQAAVLIRRCCRGHDVVGRIGGDEFAVVFWDDPQRKAPGGSAKGAERRSARADHPKEAIFIAKRFVRELEKAELAPHFVRRQADNMGTQLHLLGPEGKGVLTISGGLASFPRDGSTIQELFQQADKALLEAKRSGKNRIYLVGKPQSDISDIE
ncbi:MAG: GGDEF domain-containing protein [Planctomycetota bacterium]|jgi:PleD family two-component response regulator